MDTVKVLSLEGFENGSYKLDYYNGKVTISKLDIVIPNIDPTPEPVNPVVVPEVTAKVKSEYNKITATNKVEVAESIVVLFNELANKIDEGVIKTPQELAAAVKQSFDLILTMEGANKEDWANLRDVLTEYATDLTNHGAEMSDYKKLLEEASNGFGINYNIDPEKIKKILEILIFVLKLIAQEATHAAIIPNTKFEIATIG